MQENIGFDISLLLMKKKEIVKEFLIEHINDRKDLSISSLTDNELKIDLKKAYNDYNTNRRNIKTENNDKDEYNNLVFLKDLSKPFYVYYRFLFVLKV